MPVHIANFLFVFSLSLFSFVAFLSLILWPDFFRADCLPRRRRAPNGPYSCCARSASTWNWGVRDDTEASIVVSFS